MQRVQPTCFNQPASINLLQPTCSNQPAYRLIDQAACALTCHQPEQDKTTRLWDLRYPAASFALLKAHIGAIRSLRFRCAL